MATRTRDRKAEAARLAERRAAPQDAPGPMTASGEPAVTTATIATTPEPTSVSLEDALRVVRAQAPETLAAVSSDGATTEREGTRLPPLTIMAAEAKKHEIFVRDEENFTYLLVEDKVPGVRINQRDIAYYKRHGYEVCSVDPVVTGHAGYTLMKLPRAVAHERMLADREKNNRGYLKSGDNATRKEIRDGVVQIETDKPMRLDDIGASLPDAASVRRSEDEIARATERLAKDPRLQRGIEQALRDAEREDAGGLELDAIG